VIQRDSQRKPRALRASGLAFLKPTYNGPTMWFAADPPLEEAGFGPLTVSAEPPKFEVERRVRPKRVLLTGSALPSRHSSRSSTWP
jgi:hypothetical protein